MTEIIYSKNVLDFVTVSVEFCAFLEKNRSLSREEWLVKTARLLPMIYLKAALLPDVISLSDALPRQFVSEEDYNRVKYQIAEIMGEEDVYLDVFVEDMKYSDRPISAFISENIADMYQDLRNFVSVYQYRIAEQMNDALYACVQNFKDYWGQALVNVMRPIHALLHRNDDFVDIGHDENTDEEAIWD